VAGARQYVHVETGHYYACAVSSEYLGYCWGNGTQGQLGTGSIDGALAPVAVVGTRHYDQIAVSADDHTCAVTRGSRAFCWGINSYGQLGTGTTTESYVPVAVVGP
jgi:alpha-tubulin suppressor-like RCC1 family protein